MEGAALPVTLATAFSLRATPHGATSSEGLQLPAAVPGSGELVITAGVGRFPAIQSIGTQFFLSEPREYPNAYDAVAQIVFLPLIATYVDVAVDLPAALVNAFWICRELREDIER